MAGSDGEDERKVICRPDLDNIPPGLA
jgi:hypothetical protein